MTRAGVERIDHAGRPAWRKRHAGTERRFRLAALRLLARAGGLTPLLPPRPQSAAEACRTEQAMIARLSALGATVPEVLAVGDTELVLSDLGPTLAQACRRSDAAGRRALLARGFAALADLHTRGGHASQAFARNLVVDGPRIGFIDLEEDPATVMPLAAAQARDLLLFVHSTARFLPAADYAALLDAQLAREPVAVVAQVRRVARRLGWLAWPAALAGRRARAVAAALRALQ
jgi:tRNA A-37 threonylcarbamoyl transferase component Bud32